MSERGDVADWLGTGLQSPLIGFDSRRRLKLLLVLTGFSIRRRGPFRPTSRSQTRSVLASLARPF